MPEKEEPAPSTFESTNSDMSFEPKPEILPPTTQRIVEMPEKDEPAPSTFESKNSDMSFEPKPDILPPTTQRIVQMPEKEEPAPSTFESKTSDMSFEPKPEILPPTTQRIVQMPEKDEPAPSTFESAESGISFEAKPVPWQRIVKMTEKKEPAPSTFQKSGSGLSYEAKPLDAPKQKFVKMTENEQARPSTFRQGPNGQMFDASATKKQVPAPKSTMFRSSSAKETPPPQASMFKASAVKKESAPPQPTMFSTSAVEKKAAPESPKLFQPTSSTKQVSSPPPEKQQQQQPRVVPKPVEAKLEPPKTAAAATTMFSSKKSQSDMSFDLDSQLPKTPPKQRIVKMSEKKAVRPSTFRNDENDMMFEAAVSKKQSPPPQSTMFAARVKKQVPPTPTREQEAESAEVAKPPPSKQKEPEVVPDEPKAPVTKSEDTGILVETKQAPPTKQRIVRMAEKKEPAPSTFQSAGSGMSFEPKIEAQKKESPRKRVVKMTEKNEAPPSKVFRSDESGLMFEVRKQPSSKSTTAGSMFNVATNQPVEKKPTANRNVVKNTGPTTGSMFHHRTSRTKAIEEEELKLAEVTREEERARNAEKLRLEEEAKIQEEARIAEEARLREEARLAEEEEARIAEQIKIAKENRLSEEKEKERLDAWLAEEEKELEEMGRMVEEIREKDETTNLAEQARQEFAEEAVKIQESLDIPDDSTSLETESETVEAEPIELDAQIEADEIPEEKKELAEPTVFRSENTGISMDVKQVAPTKQRIVKMAEKKEPAQSTFQSAESGMSFEPRQIDISKGPKKQRIMKMAEKKEPSPSTFQSSNSGMSFEPNVKDDVKPTKKNIVKMSEKEEPAPSTFKSAESGISFEPRQIDVSKVPKKQRIVKMAEKKESAPSTFKSAESGMSYEPRAKDAVTPTKKRIVKMTEKKEPAQSTFQSARSGMSYEPRLITKTPERKVTVASGSVLFQPGTKKANFESDGSQFVHQSPKEKKLFLAQKVAAQMFTAKRKVSAFETDDSGMNMVVTTKRSKVPPVTTGQPSSPTLVSGSDGQSRVLPKNTDNGGMKMTSYVGNEMNKQPTSAFGNIQQSKFDVSSAKKTAEDIQKLAKFVSDGLQMVYAESQKKNVVTPEEARHQRTERNRKKVLGFEIGPSEEELARQMLEEGKHLAVEGGKQFAKFASDGLQMVYQAAEKQTKEYIASKQSEASKKKSSSVRNLETEKSASTPFYATNDVAKKDGKDEPTFSASTTNPSNPFFASTEGDDATEPLPQGERPKIDESSPSTSSMIRSGGRMFAKFVGDGLQMVQRVTKQKDKRYRRPPK